jgi:hypothetical protein
MKSRNLALGTIAAGALGASILASAALADQERCAPGSNDKQYCEHHHHRRHHHRYGDYYKDVGGTIIAFGR